MRKPLIGLTPAHDLKEGDIKARPTYLRALEAAGAIPVVMPLEVSKEDLKQLAEELDGFLFTGGPDVHPFLFGEETHERCGNVSAKRDRMELDLFPLVLELHKPVFGICRGIQVLNIALGGNIWQDIPSQTKREFPLAHSQPFYYDMPCHTVTLKEGSRLAEISKGLSINVNSMHHQAVKDLGRGTGGRRIFSRRAGGSGGNARTPLFNWGSVASGILMGKKRRGTPVISGLYRSMQKMIGKSAAELSAAAADFFA